MDLTAISYRLSEIDDIASDILKHQKSNIYCFSGDLGSGKTTLIQALCKQLGVTDTISSPTFSLIQVYNSPQGDVAHMDLYRLKHPNELTQIGFEDTLYDSKYNFIEWYEIAEKLLPRPYYLIQLSTINPENKLLKMGMVYEN